MRQRYQIIFATLLICFLRLCATIAHRARRVVLSFLLDVLASLKANEALCEAEVYHEQGVGLFPGAD